MTLLIGTSNRDPEPFPDNWIYLHDPGTRAGRVQNFGAWSPGMTRPGFTCLGAEYFCFQGDETWSLPDHALVELAKRELGRIGLIDPSHVVDGVAIRVPRAYPMYDKGYDAASRSYKSTWAELTLGCESCHGPSGPHATAAREGRSVPTGVGKMGPGQQGTELAVCGPCHARPGSGPQGREAAVATPRSGTGAKALTAGGPLVRRLDAGREIESPLIEVPGGQKPLAVQIDVERARGPATGAGS